MAALRRDEGSGPGLRSSRATAPTPPSCGIAYVMTSNSTSFAPLIQRGRPPLRVLESLVRARGPVHNMGAGSRPVRDGLGRDAVPYSHGYVKPGGARPDDHGLQRPVHGLGLQLHPNPILLDAEPDGHAGKQSATRRCLDNASDAERQTASTVASLVQAVTLSLQDRGDPDDPWQRTDPERLGSGSPTRALPGAADFYIGLLLPDRQYRSPSSRPRVASPSEALADLGRSGPWRQACPLGAPFSTAVPSFLSCGWLGTEPRGNHTFFLPGDAGGGAGRRDRPAATRSSESRPHPSVPLSQPPSTSGNSL